MDITLPFFKERYKIEIAWINLIFLFYLFRTALPVMKYPFLVLYTGAVIYIFLKYRQELISRIKQFSRSFLLILVLALIQIVAFLISAKIYLSIFKEVINILILLSLFFSLFLVINFKKELIYFINNLIFLIILFGLGISLLGILVRLTIINISDSDKLDYNFSLLPVYFGIIGSVFKQSQKGSKINRFLYYLIFIILTLQILLSGSRRGIIALMLASGILSIIQLIGLISRKSDQWGYLGRLRSASTVPLFIFLLTPLFYYLILYNASFSFKEATLNLFGVKQKSTAKYNLTYGLYRYVSSIDQSIDFMALYNRIWPSEFPSIDPERGWGSRQYKTISTLSGVNAEIVPERSKGYLIDSAAMATYRTGNSVVTHLIDNLKLKNNDVLETSLYCFVSKDFTGSSVELTATGSATGNIEAKSGLYTSPRIMRDKSFNLFNNGDFQKGTMFWLPNADSTKHQIIETPFGKGIRVTRTFGTEDWSLQYVGRNLIYYANHLYRFHFYFRAIHGGEIPFNIGWWVNDGGQGFLTTLKLNLEIKDLDNGWKEASCSYRFKEKHYSLVTFLNSMASNSTVEFANIELFDLDLDNTIPVFMDEEKGIWHKLSVKTNCSNGRIDISLILSNDRKDSSNAFRGYIIFTCPQYNVIRKTSERVSENTRSIPVNKNSLTFNNQNYYSASLMQLEISAVATNNDSIDNDPIRRFVSKFISEDTTYHGYRTKLSVDTIHNNFLGMRLMRWQFAIQVFAKEYNWKKKLFGGGFNFLNWFSHYFERDNKISDYPHNPLLSILLYSGIFGLFLYLILLYKSFYYCYAYFTDFPILSFYFAITFFFSFFSAGSPFDPPIMGFFIILPNFIHTIKEKILVKY
jgi:hypothetical protein